MSNRNWVCFECRLVIRRPEARTEIPKCSGCRSDCTNLGYKTEVPARDDIKAWKTLRDQTRTELIRAVDVEREQAVRSIHSLEKDISRLEDKGSHPERARLIKRLKETLEFEKKKLSGL